MFKRVRAVDASVSRGPLEPVQMAEEGGDGKEGSCHFALRHLWTGSGFSGPRVGVNARQQTP